MATPTQRLWRLNNEYRKRLSKVGNALDLLEHLLAARAGDAPSYTLDILRHAQSQVTALADEHRGWRYAYFYESADDKRMVNDEGAVYRALARFERMCARHERVLSEVYAALGSLPRPDPALTHVANGDLWLFAQYAMDDLATFITAPDG